MNNFLALKPALYYVNHAYFDDAEKKSFDNDCHHKKGGECECMNT